MEDRTLLTTTTFMIDPTQSSLSLMGSRFTYNGTNYPILEQDYPGSGSLNTTYSGPLVTDVDLTGNTINFLGASSGTALAAGISGNWQPGMGGVSGGRDAANYGGTFVFLGINYTAIRNMMGSLLTNAPVALTAQGGGSYTYPSNQNIQIDAGNLDYDTGLFGTGSTSISGLAGQNQAAAGTLQDNGDGTFTLTVNVSGSFFYDLGGGASATVQINGSLVGTGTPGTAPSAGHRQGRDLALAISQVATSHTIANLVFADVGNRHDARLAGSPIADSPEAATLVPGNGVNPAALSPIHQGGALASSAAVDGVFLDLIQNTGVLLADM
jgi:hypothetical protein